MWTQKETRQVSTTGDIVRMTTSISLSIALLSLVLLKNNDQAMRTFKEYFRKIVDYLTDDEPSAVDAQESEEDRRIVKHKGCCHCAAVGFQITAPRTLLVQEGSGKIPYPRTLVKAKCFKLRQGMEALQTYYVGTSTAAHTFCSQCGVHLLYAPSPQSSYLFLNVDCLQPGWKKKIVVLEDDDDDEDFDYKIAYQHFHEGKSAEGYATEYTPPPPRGRSVNKFPDGRSLGKTIETTLPSTTTTEQSRKITPHSSGKRMVDPTLFSAVALARENSWQVSGPSVTNVKWRNEEAPDDISEPTIPMDLVSTADAVSVDEGSVRSHFTEATARSMRLYLSKHLKRPSPAASPLT